MIYPSIDDLLTKTDNRFSLVIVGAKRARQINSYFRALRHHEPTESRPPQVKTSSTNPLTIAFEELAKGKITYERIIEGIK